MGCGTSFVKYVLFFFNLLFALVGLAMVGIGVAVIMHWKVMGDILKDNLTVAPWLFIIVGVAVFIIAFFGCCGAIRESHCMTVTYAIFLLVVIIVQVTLAALMFVYAESIQDGLTRSVAKLYDASRQDQAARVTYDNLEIQLECCGRNGPQDYGVTSVVNLPESCCTRGPDTIGRLLNACTFTTANSVGCETRVADFYQKWNKTIAGVAIGVACIEVVGALFALCLANSIRNMDRRYA